VLVGRRCEDLVQGEPASHPRKSVNHLLLAQRNVPHKCFTITFVAQEQLLNTFPEIISERQICIRYALHQHRTDIEFRLGMKHIGCG